MSWRLIGIMGTALLCCGCERALHQMYEQPKYKPLTPAPLFKDGNSSRPQAPGTVAHSAGAAAGASSGRLGLTDAAPPVGPAVAVDEKGRSLVGPPALDERAYSNPVTVTPELLARGRNRFEIYCAPCHSRAGDGDGMIVRRGFPRPPSYHIDRLRNAPDSHFYQVISAGYGVMYAYADRIDPADRWAIVAYIRALQLSQHVPAGALTAQDRARLQGPPR